MMLKLKGLRTLSRRGKAVLIIILFVLLWLGHTYYTSTQKKSPTYQSSQAVQKTLIVSITASGTVSTANNTPINTQVSGVVRALYAGNGQNVSSGDKILEIELDQSSQQKYSQTLASYQSAKNAVDAANANFYSLRSKKDTAWKEFYDIATSSQYENDDGSPREDMRNSSAEFQSAQGDWLAAEATVKNQQNVINQTQTALSSAWRTLQESSPILYAPISGTVTGLTVQEGSVIATKTASSDTSTSTSQKLASVQTDASPIVSVNLTEIDVVKVALGDTANITIDAFPDRTFRGTVFSIDTVGSVSSGVTTYPTVITLDSADAAVLTNMSASATIITDTKQNALVVPSSAITTENGTSIVKIRVNGRVRPVEVKTGLASDTETEILSGLKAGDTVITGTSASSTGTTSKQNSQNRSIFSPAGGMGGMRR